MWRNSLNNLFVCLFLTQTFCKSSVKKEILYCSLEIKWKVRRGKYIITKLLTVIVLERSSLNIQILFIKRKRFWLMFFHPAIVITENYKKMNQECMLRRQVTKGIQLPFVWHTNKKNSANRIYTMNGFWSVLDSYILYFINDLLVIWTKLKYSIYIYSKQLFPCQTDLTQSVLYHTKFFNTCKTLSFLFKI